MQIELSDEKAYKLAGDVLIQQYKDMGGVERVSEYTGNYPLLDAFREVIMYCTTAKQRKEAGL
jgi:hypothetical protein